ncbi:MAG: DUF1232 domain-containing protein [Schwartzia sp.]|nr:DUF1232 domain-containing protein [Schwartzia sp. (in: firmicutes)]
MSGNTDIENADMEKYEKDFSEEGFWDKVTGKVKSAGLGLIYNALQLFYAAQNPSCPPHVKAGIYAALGYFILPLDLIPDFTPVVGYGDDVSAIGAAIVMAQMYIDDNVKQQARDKIQSLFGDEMLQKLDEA